MKKIVICLAVALAPLPSPALAYDWNGTAKVTLIEGTYAPGNLPFQVDRSFGSCAAGTMLMWVPRGADPDARAQSYAAVLALLMTAKSTGQSVTVFGNNSNCAIDFIYLS